MSEGLTRSPGEIYCPECGRTVQRDSRQCNKTRKFLQELP